MNHIYNIIGIIIGSITVVLIYCGLTVIGVLGKIIEWFA